MTAMRKTKWDKAQIWTKRNVEKFRGEDGTRYGYYFLFDYAWLAGYNAGLRKAKQLRGEVR